MVFVILCVSVGVSMDELKGMLVKLIRQMLGEIQLCLVLIELQMNVKDIKGVLVSVQDVVNVVFDSLEVWCFFVQVQVVVGDGNQVISFFNKLILLQFNVFELYMLLVQFYMMCGDKVNVIVFVRCVFIVKVDYQFV